MIEVLPGFPDDVIGLRCAGHLTREDYETVLIPALDAAFKRHQKLHAYLQVDSFSGISPDAMWDTVKVKVGHFTQWGRVALVTDVEWISHMVQLLTFLMPWDVRLFPLADAEKARAWIVAPETAPGASHAPIS
jgi:hypothetical protein